MKKKKLQLNKETIASLNESIIAEVKGGGIKRYSYLCVSYEAMCSDFCTGPICQPDITNQIPCIEVTHGGAACATHSCWACSTPTDQPACW